MHYDVKNFTLEEKLKLLTGKDSWSTYDAEGKVKSVHVSDGPHGLRKVEDKKTVKATAMPNLAAIANSWSKEAARLDGETIASEYVEKDVDVILAPGVNIKKTPLCGRNFEYFSEDPYLAGELAKEYIDGAQSLGIGTSLKHFCCNNREYERFFQTSEIDERTLREIYLPAFEKALEAKPWTVMCSYNLINGVYASENKYILKDILRDEFGYDGLIVSDWGAVHSEFRRILAGLDLGMPYSKGSYDELKSAYEKGYITEEQIDERVRRVLDLIEKTINDKKTVRFDKEKRHENAVKIAKESIVLLKNEDDILPLKGGKILVEGQLSANPITGGSGSACVETEFVQRPLSELLSEKLGESAKVEYLPSVSIAVENSHNVCWNLRGGYKKAYDSDTVVICVGNNGDIEGESFDRVDIRLSEKQEEFIINTAKYNENVVVVIYAGSAIDTSAWADKVKAIVYAGFLGEAANEAVSSVLVGETIPSGKLSETFPYCLEDTFAGGKTCDGFVDRYSEGVFVGYRYYEKTGTPVAFPFGHGLSYAKFTYSNMKIKKNGETDFEVSYDITNESDFAAKEVSQVYVKDVFAMVSRPEKELKGFSKIEIGAHETKTVTVNLDYRSFAYYNTSLKKWHVENGAFEILVGASSEDIRLTERIDIELPETEQQSV